MNLIALALMLQVSSATVTFKGLEDHWSMAMSGPYLN